MTHLKYYGKGKHIISFRIQWGKDYGLITFYCQNRREQAHILRLYRKARKWWQGKDFSQIDSTFNIPLFSLRYLARKDCFIVVINDKNIFTIRKKPVIMKKNK